MIKTGEQYLEDMKRIKPTVYMKGEKVESPYDDPRWKSSLNLMVINHDVCFKDETKDIAVAYEPLVNENVRRFATYIQRTMEDSITKVQLTRELCADHICGWCQSNVMNILWAVTYEIDDKYNTEYHSRYIEFTKHIMRNDYDVFWAMMDPKGDRTKKRTTQKNPTGVRIIKKDEKGIVVSGAKVSTSGASCSQYIFCVPCSELSEEEKDYAVAFVVPTDAKGLSFICKKAPQRENPANDMECPMGSEIGMVEGMTLFDEVFVPWEDVFMCGEYDMAGRVAYYFGNLQRQSKCACLAGHTDLICGVGKLIADVNGLGMKPPHIKNKITALMMESEVAMGCALGAASAGKNHPSGVFIPDTSIANAGLNYIKNLTGNQIQFLHDIAGGIITTMPSQTDYKNPELKIWMDTYLSGSDQYTTEERLRVLYFAQEIAASNFTGYFMSWAINASGSPATGEVFVKSHYDLNKRVEIAKKWAKIDS